MVDLQKLVPIIPSDFKKLLPSVYMPSESSSMTLTTNNHPNTAKDCTTIMETVIQKSAEMIQIKPFLLRVTRMTGREVRSLQRNSKLYL
jgi:hypothetical protein